MSPTQDVQQLRQLVERGSPDEPADRPHPEFVRHVPPGCRLGVVHRPKAAELEELELLAVATYPDLPEQHAWATLQPHREGHREHDGCSEKQCEAAYCDVHGALDPPRRTSTRRPTDALNRNRTDMIPARQLSEGLVKPRDDEDLP